MENFKVDANNASKSGYDAIIHFLISNKIEFSHTNHNASIKIADKEYTGLLLTHVFKEFVNDLNTFNIELHEIIDVHIKINHLKKLITDRYCDNTRFELNMGDNTLEINLEDDVLTINDLDSFVYNNRVFKRIEEELS